MKKISVLYLLCSLLGPSCVIAQARVIINRNPELTTFEPSDQWKPVKEGQAIPPGLHVRFNLTSNTVEAKKLDPTSKNDPNTNVVLVPQDDLNRDNVKHKETFRNYKEIKQTLKELNLEAHSEVALMIKLVRKARKLINSKDHDEKELLVLLSDLTDKVEQIDVGREFAQIRGIDNVVIASLNKSAEVRSSALLLLGSALQNNQPVQIAAYKAGLLNILLALITSEKDQVLARAIFSLSALIRRLPIAQKMMVDRGGAGLLIEVFNAHEPRIQGKILSLIYDLLIEQLDANLTLKEAATNVQTDIGKEELKLAIDRQTQYKSIRLDVHLVNHGWCSRLVNYMHDIQGERRKIHKDDECPNISQPEHDKVEKVLNAMLALKQNCKAIYKESKELPCTVVRFIEQYEALRLCENEHVSEPDKEVAHYYGNIKELFVRLARFVGNGQPLQCKDEL